MLLSKCLSMDNQLALLIDGGWYGAALDLAQQAGAAGLLAPDVVGNIVSTLSPVPRSLHPRDRVYGPVSSGSQSLLSSLQFRALDDYDDMKAAFKQAIVKVEIETSTLCNRHCAYCPNDELDVPHRRTVNKHIDFDLFVRTLSNLREIDYNHEIGLVGLNEFFMTEENFKYLEQVKKFLPDCKLVLYSNGDYITREYLERAASLGVNIIVVSFHMQYKKAWNTDDILDRVVKLQARTGLVVSEPQFERGTSLFFYGRVGNMVVQCGLRNYADHGHNWGGAVHSGRGATSDDSPCIFGVEQFVMCHTGDINICCNVAREPTAFNRESGATVCNLNDFPSIFHAYSSPAFRSMRRRAFSQQDLPDVCRSCFNRNLPLHAGNKELATMVAANHPLTDAAAE